MTILCPEYGSVRTVDAKMFYSLVILNVCAREPKNFDPDAFPCPHGIFTHVGLQRSNVSIRKQISYRCQPVLILVHTQTLSKKTSVSLICSHRTMIEFKASLSLYSILIRPEPSSNATNARKTDASICIG